MRYAKCVGFGVRKGDVSRDGDGNLIRQKNFCNRAGLREKKHYMRVDRKRDHKPETRTNCMARLHIYLDKRSATWKVRCFEEAQNHELTPLRFVHLIPNHRRMTDAEKAQIDSMHRSGIQTSQIMGFMVGQAGGYGGIGFSKKDLYNYIDRQRCSKIIDGDVCAAISYLQGKANAEPMTVARYSYIDDDRLGNLFWSDCLSRVNYQYFGDVLAFDSTYKKNKYNKSLVIFSGTNHHRQTCIFGFALLEDEGADTYKWLLENFLDVMASKQPSVVVTDGDEAMREAIKVVFPDATHRPCAWHLEKNATANIKDPEFCQAFKKCIYANFDPEEFEEYWQNIVGKFELHDNRWVKKAYGRKEMWANAYLRDKFSAGFRTTSRCEGINSFIKRLIKSRHSILELVQNLDRAVRDSRNNELVAQFNSMYSEPVLTIGLDSIEQAAVRVYTREIFKEVKKQMEGASSLLLDGYESLATTAMYKLCKFGKPGPSYEVLYDRNLQKFECQCRLWNSRGIPCSHMFYVMKNEHIAELPEMMIMKRWRKDAKYYPQCDDKEGEDSEKSFLLRYGALYSASLWMSFLGAKKFPSFCKAMDVICRISSELEQGCGKVCSAPSIKIGDLATARTKSAPLAHEASNKKRRCSNCNLIGHAKKNCPMVKGRNSQHNEDVFSPPTKSDDGGNDNPTPNKEGKHNPVESLASMKQAHTVNHAETTSISGIRGTHCCPLEQSKVVFGRSQINQFYPPISYPVQPYFVGPSVPIQQLAPGGPSNQHLGLGQYQYIPYLGHQWYLQNIHGNHFTPHENKK